LKLVLGNPGWLELRLDGALWWRSLKSRATGGARPGRPASAPPAADKAARPKRARVFFDWP